MLPEEVERGALCTAGGRLGSGRDRAAGWDALLETVDSQPGQLRRMLLVTDRCPTDQQIRCEG